MSTERFTDIPTDYRELIGITPDELGIEFAASSRFFEHRHANGQTIGLYETMPTGYDVPGSTLPNRTIIVPASHDYRIEPSWMDRADIIANSADARVILVDMPGTTGLMHQADDGSLEVYSSKAGLKGARQTQKQFANAVAGNFRPHADVQLDSIIDRLGIDPAGETILMGESMGAQTVTDMLGLMHERDLPVETVILYEAVNTHDGYHPQVPIRLASVLSGVENDRRTLYIEENTRIGVPSTAFEMQADAPWQKELDSARKTIGQQALAAAANGLGMSRGIMTRLSRNIDSMAISGRPDVMLVRGRESLASSAKGYEALNERLKGIGVTTELFHVTDSAPEAVPMGHSHSFSLARHRQVSDVLFKR